MAKTAPTAAARVHRGGARGRLELDRVSPATVLGAARRLAFLLVCFGLPLALTSAVAYQMHRLGMLHFDFVGTVWEPSHAIVDGDSPFPAAERAAVDVGNPALYPPSIVLVALPLLALPFTVASWVWTAALAAAVAGSLYVLGVRDRRCFAVALLSYPVALALGLGNLTLLLVLAAAIAWAYRDRPLVAGAAVGLAVALKLFLWPLAVWLLATRRFRGAAASVTTGALALLVPWALIGFAGLPDYASLLRVADAVFAEHSNSLFAGVLGLGLPESAARAVALAAGGALLVAVVLLARREDGDRRSFAAALAASLVLTPIVWAHYFAVLLVPLAIVRPRFARLWLVFPAAWLVFLLVPLPRGTSAGKPADVPAQIWEPLHATTPALWQTLAYGSLFALVLARALQARRNERTWRA